LEQIVRTAYSAAMYLFQLGYGCAIGFLLACIPSNKQKREEWFHNMIHKSLRMDVLHIGGVKTVVRNEHGEDFSRGSITICNHQSILDPVYLLALSPKVLIIIGEKVWHNPIVHLMFKFARFINVGLPAEEFKAEVRKAVADGYNVVFFPEAARSSDGRILRFHKGAFELAKAINADILPLYLHGIGDVMPKGSGFARRGQVTIEIGKRIPAADVPALGGTSREIAHAMRQQYIAHYAEMRRTIENAHYFHHHIIYKYIYKGISVERETKRLLRRHDDFSGWIDREPTAGTTFVLNAGKGQFALLYALVHPEVQVHSYAFDKDDAQLAACCTYLPQNLHISYPTDMSEAMADIANISAESPDIFLLFPDEEMRRQADSLHPITIR